MSVSEAAAKYRFVRNTGAYTGPWDNDEVNYMVEPANILTSRERRACIFVGPAQSTKTDALIINWLLYSVIVHPMDMMCFCPSNANAKDFSIRRVDRLNQHSVEVGKRLVDNRDSDTRFQKQYKAGMLFTLSWPSKGEMAGRPVGRIALTDYDRMEQNVDGEGSPFDLASKRTTTFLSYAMTLAESSPSFPVTNRKWIASYGHEAPPCEGIIALYNRGDMRRWYWPCPLCHEYFMPQFEMIKWRTDMSDPAQMAETAYMECPCCRGRIGFSNRRTMNMRGLWVAEGQKIIDGVVTGKPYPNSIASFWLEGTAAAFVTWKQLVNNYLVATREKENTGSEEALKKFYNTDLGRPYIPDGDGSDMLPETLQSRCEEIPKGKVAADVRFLVATVDVQPSSFVVQVHGVRPGRPADLVVVDRFHIWESVRLDETGKAYAVRPHTYAEDWDLLIDRVINASYELGDGSGRRMRVKITACDSGGKEGVTDKAYNFWRKINRSEDRGRFFLVKGDSRATIPRISVTYPDAGHKDKFAIARGDVPVWLLNTNQLKDSLYHMLECVVPGKGQYVIPSWVESTFYEELTSEIRTSKGWIRPTKRRNEAWDLAYYCIAITLSPMVNIENIDWEKPPSWAADWDSNSLVSKAGAPVKFASGKNVAIDWAALGRTMAGK